MSWLTENPWPLILLLAGASVLLFLLGQNKARLFAVVVLLSAVGVYFLEQAIVTPSEHVELSLQKLHQAFLAEDLTTIDSLISDAAPQLRQQARSGLEMVDLDEGFHLQDVSVTVSEDQKSAEMHLRANGTLRLRENNMSTHAATRWRTKWVLSDEKWALQEVHRLNPLNGDEIGILDRQ